MKRIMMFLMLVVMTMITSASFAGVHFRMKGRAGSQLQSTFSFNVGSPTMSRGSTCNTSLPIYVISRRGRDVSSEIVDESGIIDFGNAMEGEIFVAPEFDRPLRSLTFTWADGRTKTIDYPKFVYSKEHGVRGIRQTIHPRWPGEVLSIVIQYCDERGVPELPELYEYTVTGGNR